MTARSRRLGWAFASLAALCLLLPALAAAAPESAAQRLAAKYAPITMVREEQEPPCEKSAEQYQPTSVETMLGNPTVTLQRQLPDGNLEDVKRAPRATDIAALGDGYFLNLRGEALGETCVYAKDFAKLVDEGRAPVISYAHIARESGHSGFALQYWFFWYFNQFNDLHEGDWEGMQLTFEAQTPAAALREEPGEVIVFQHAGGERASWSDSKVQKQGTHPVVYPAAGSHATFYDSAVYVQNGQNGSGVGCDNTTSPLRELRPRPVLLPETAPLEGRYEWLSYMGRWGEREKGFNNGPTGPVTKTVWSEPFSWMEGQRSTSPRLPAGSIVGPQAVGAFCGAVATVSDLINLEAESHLAAVITIVLAVALVALFVLVTKWRPVDLEQLEKRRAFGQLVRAARQLYGRHWLVLVPIGLTALPIVGGVNLLSTVVAGDRTVDKAKGGLHLALADLLELIGRPIAEAVVAAAVIVFVRSLVRGAPAGFLDSYRGMARRFGRVVLGSLGASLGVLAMAVTIVGLPFAVWKLVGWQFVQQEILFEDRTVREAFRGSSERVRGRWWHTVRVTLFLFLVSVVAGPVVGFALIFSNFSLLWINIIGSLIFALLIPYVALGHTLLYFDLGARAETEPAKPRRHLWRRFRRRHRPQRVGFET